MKIATLVALMVLGGNVCASNAQTAPSPAGPDSTLLDEAMEDYQSRVRYGFLLDPFSVYSSTYGFGIRGLATLYNLPFTGSRLRATLRPYQRRGTYGLTLRTHDPMVEDVFGLFRFRFESNNAYRYYGLGTASEERDRLFVNMDRLQLLGRLGFQFVDDHLMVQPFAQYVWNKVIRVDEDDDPTVLDNRSYENLGRVLGQDPTSRDDADSIHRGVKVGVSFVTDYRNRQAYPTSGFLASVTGLRYESQDDTDVKYNQFRADAHAFVDLGREHVFALRGLVETTDNKGEDPIPFFLLPEVDYSVLGGLKGHRLVDNDMIVLTAEYRWPVVNLADLYQVSGFLQAGVGNVFEDIGDMNLSVSFDNDFGPDDLGLRPGFGIGLRVSALEQGRDMIYWMLGAGPEGVTLAAFRFVHSLTDIQ